MTDYIQSILVFNIGVPRQYLDFFNMSKIRISLFYMRENMELVYTQKRRRNGHCIFFLKDYIQSSFVFNIGVPRKYLDFCNSSKIRISLFYMREHMELVYVL